MLFPRLSKHLLLLLCLLLSASTVQARRRKDGNPQSRGIGILNRAGAKFDCYWIHPHTKALSESQTEGAGVVHGGETSISSYIGHSFECQELPRKSTGTCLKEECQKCYITVSANEDQMFTVGPDFEVTVEDHKTRARQKAAESIAACSAEEVADLDPAEQIDRLADCMQQQVEAAMEKSGEEIDFQANVRKQLGQSWVHYACDDVNMTTTTPIENQTWTFAPPKMPRSKYSHHEVNIYFESDASRLQRFQNVLSPAECSALQESAQVLSTSTTPLGSNYGLSNELRKKNKVIDLVITKLEALVGDLTSMSVSMSNKNPMLELRIVSAENNNNDDSSSGEEECEVQADGSNTCAAAASDSDSDTPSPSSIVPRVKVKVDDPRIIVTVLLVCEAPTEGGQIYFPKTGSVLIPADMVGSAIVLLHEIRGTREEDPFIDEYLICPVKQGKMVTMADNLAR